MFNLTLKIAGAAVGLALGIGLSGSLAATCPVAPIGDYIQVTTGGGSDTASCGGGGTWYGDENNGLTGGNDIVVSSGWTLIATVGGDGGTNGALTVTGSVNSGTWYLNPLLLVGWTDFVLGVKDGNASPNWAAFLLGANALLTTVLDPGTWFASDVRPPPFDLSHANLYAKVSPNGGLGEVPLPGALPLLVSALGGLGFFRWLRRKAV